MYSIVYYVYLNYFIDYMYIDVNEYKKVCML